MFTDLNREAKARFVERNAGTLNQLATVLTTPGLEKDIEQWVVAAVRIPEAENDLDEIFWMLDAAAHCQGPNRKAQNAANRYRTLLVTARQQWEAAAAALSH